MSIVVENQADITISGDPKGSYTFEDHKGGFVTLVGKYSFAETQAKRYFSGTHKTNYMTIYLFKAVVYSSDPLDDSDDGGATSAYVNQG